MNNLKNILFSLVLLLSGFSAVGQTSTTSAFPFNVPMTAYFDLKNALISGNSGVISDKAKTLQTAITNALTDQTNKNAGNSLKKILSDASFIAVSNDVAAQKNHFASLSAGMYELVKNTGVKGITIYQQYCPMKKATWMSETPAIQNPYFGNTMPNCGRTVATIPSK